MKAFEIARRLDALPILVTILGIYWLTTTITVLTAPTKSMQEFVAPSGLSNYAPDSDTEKAIRDYLILSDSDPTATWHYVDPLTEAERVPIEDFVSAVRDYLILSDPHPTETWTYVNPLTGAERVPVEDYWNLISPARKQEILEQSARLTNLTIPVLSRLTTEEILDLVNQALASQVGILEIVTNANGETFIFTGTEFIRWQPRNRFLAIPIDVAP